MFCAHGGMHCEIDNVDHNWDEWRRDLTDEQHPAGAPHRVMLRRVLRFPWEARS